MANIHPHTVTLWVTLCGLWSKMRVYVLGSQQQSADTLHSTASKLQIQLPGAFLGCCELTDWDVLYGPPGWEEESSFQVWGQGWDQESTWRTSSGSGWGQTPAEQREGGVERDEAENWLQGWRETANELNCFFMGLVPSPHLSLTGSNCPGKWKWLIALSALRDP